MKKWYQIWYLDSRAMRTWQREIKAKSPQDAENQHYNEYPKTLITKIVLIQK